MLFRRSVKSIRFFSKIEKFKEKQDKALRELYERECEVEKQKLDHILPYSGTPQEVSEAPSPPPLPIFGESSEEEPAPFFLEDVNSTQYIYSPSAPLSFNEEGYSKIFQKAPGLFNSLKLKYCWKLLLPLAVAGTVTLQPFIYGYSAILLSWLYPVLLYTRGRVATSIWLHNSGTKLKVEYSFTSQELLISKLPPPSGNLFLFWSLYEFPDDLCTYASNHKLERVAFAKKINRWKFFILTREPQYVNREVLVNALNGIYIDVLTASSLPSENLQDRYQVLSSKNIN